jgi:folate-binding protein YgfZ
MSDALNIDVADAVRSTDTEILPLMRHTPLASALLNQQPETPLAEFANRLTPDHFSSLEQELGSLLNGCGVFDLGWRAQIAVRGEDRLRWLSGMVTNAVQQIPNGTGNYSFLLNAQGRIQGDAYVYRSEGEVLLDTSADQVEPLMQHLDRFIIMDDVTLVDLREDWTSLGLAGPGTAALLAGLGIGVPEVNTDRPVHFAEATHDEGTLTIIASVGVLTPQVQILCAPSKVAVLWKLLLGAGAEPCGLQAIEALRILEALPRYGADLNDRDLPQETSQTRALNFTKGCYLGQEIVERIRSRGAVHKALRQFSLQGNAPILPAEISSGDKPIGTLTSAVSLLTTEGPVMYGLGIVRSEAAAKGAPLTYNGGVALVCERPPSLSFA